MHCGMQDRYGDYCTHVWILDTLVHIFLQVHTLTLCGGDGMSLWEGEGSSFLLCCLNFSSSSSDFTNVVTYSVIYTLSKMAKMETIYNCQHNPDSFYHQLLHYRDYSNSVKIHSYVGVSNICIIIYISGSHIYNKAIHTVEGGEIWEMKTNLIHS